MTRAEVYISANESSVSVEEGRARKKGGKGETRSIALSELTRYYRHIFIYSRSFRRRAPLNRDSALSRDGLARRPATRARALNNGHVINCPESTRKLGSDGCCFAARQMPWAAPGIIARMQVARARLIQEDCRPAERNAKRDRETGKIKRADLLSEKPTFPLV